MSERTEQFKKELLDLCRKFKVTYFEAKDEYPGYAECGEDIRITIDFDGDYTVDPPIPYETLDLGCYFEILEDKWTLNQFVSNFRW